VQFKFIVRQLAKPDQAKPAAAAFRADDFEVQSRLLVPQVAQRMVYVVIDAKGRAVAEGSVALNEFGTASGSITLNAEATIGVYSLRRSSREARSICPWRVCGAILPPPSFELTMVGVPELAGDYARAEDPVPG